MKNDLKFSSNFYVLRTPETEKNGCENEPAKHDYDSAEQAEFIIWQPCFLIIYEKAFWNLSVN